MLNLIKKLASDAFKIYADGEFALSQKLKLFKMQKDHVSDLVEQQDFTPQTLQNVKLF